MSKVLELRQKRGNLWDKAKDFLDNAKRENGVLSADDVAAYEKMEAEIVSLGKEIEILERQTALDLELNKATTTPIKTTPQANGSSVTLAGRASAEYKDAFWKSMRNKTSYEVVNALQIGDDTEGGYLVPSEFEATLIQGLNEENIIRSLATVIPSSGDKKIPVVAANGEASWVEEEGEIPESDDKFGLLTLGAHKISTMIKVSEELINDSAFNLEQYIAKEFSRRIASAEENAFINGNGTGKPTGLLQTAQIGVTAGSNIAITADEIIDLYHSLKTPYRKKACFSANDMTIKAIRQLKDTTGNYIWKAGILEGQPDTILGLPVKTSYYIPTIAPGAKILMVGDLSYYWIADRQGRSFQRLNELFAKNGQIGFRVSQRVDGKLTLPESVKVLKMKA